MLVTMSCQNTVTGRWKMIECSYEAGSPYRELCDCPDGHETYEEAKNCPHLKTVSPSRSLVPITVVESLQKTIRDKDEKIERLQTALNDAYQHLKSLQGNETVSECEVIALCEKLEKVIRVEEWIDGWMSRRILCRHIRHDSCVVKQETACTQIALKIK